MARPLAFDPQEKLHQAMLLFWRKGYEATSMQDLVDALHINRFSLYNTFGDKEALYQQVIQYYRKHVFGHLEARLQPASDGLPRLFDYLDALYDGLGRQPGPWGCLLQNSVMYRDAFSPSLQAQVDEFIQVLHGHVLAIMKAARHLDQVPKNQSPEELADFVVTHIQGLLMISKSCPPDVLKNSISVLRGFLAFGSG